MSCVAFNGNDPNSNPDDPQYIPGSCGCETSGVTLLKEKFSLTSLGSIHALLDVASGTASECPFEGSFLDSAKNMPFHFDEYCRLTDSFYATSTQGDYWLVSFPQRLTLEGNVYRTTGEEDETWPNGSVCNYETQLTVNPSSDFKEVDVTMTFPQYIYDNCTSAGVKQLLYSAVRQ